MFVTTKSVNKAALAIIPDCSDKHIHNRNDTIKNVARCALNIIDFRKENDKKLMFGLHPKH